MAFRVLLVSDSDAPLLLEPGPDASAAPTPLESLRRSLAGGRLAHAYLFLGDDSEVLTEAALVPDRSDQLSHTSAAIAQRPRARRLRRRCSTGPRIAKSSHPDVLWVRPQNKMRQITSIRPGKSSTSLSMKPTEAQYKVAIFVGAYLDEHLRGQRLSQDPGGTAGGSAPPILLLSTEPERLLETILSRCQRLNFGTGARLRVAPGVLAWLREFGQHAAKPGAGLLPRYQLLGTLLNALTALRESLEASLTAASPLERYPDASPEQKERWEDELKAAIESGIAIRN